MDFVWFDVFISSEIIQILLGIVTHSNIVNILVYLSANAARKGLFIGIDPIFRVFGVNRSKGLKETNQDTGKIENQAKSEDALSKAESSEILKMDS